MTDNRYVSRRRTPAANKLLLGVHPLLLMAAVVCGLVVLWVVWTVFLTASPVSPH